jgi:hypothetical protein
VRAALHVLSVVLLLPSLIFASAFLFLGHAIAQQSLLGFFLQLLADASWLVSWGLLAAGAIAVLIVAGGFSIRFRWLASLMIALLALVSGLLVAGLSSSPVTLNNALFFLPGLVSLCIGGWLAVNEWPSSRDVSAAA